MTTMDIFSIILMGAASALCVALIFFVIKLSGTVTGLDKSLKEMTAQLRPVTLSVTGLTERLNGIVEELKAPLNASINVFLKLKERVDLLLDVEENIRETVISQVSAVVNGIKSFTDVYKGNGHVPKHRAIFKS